MEHTKSAKDLDPKTDLTSCNDDDLDRTAQLAGDNKVSDILRD